tara:strand:- start:873 stop:1079 length:207 start_codon:yes stop_codon:yes gene_type:complete
MSKKLINIHRLAEEYGFGLKRQKKHLVWQHVVSGYIVTTSKTFSDARALRNIESNFKKASKLSISNSS